MSDKRHIESRLRRAAGMSAAKVEEMHAAAADQHYWARCWNCKKTVEMKLSALKSSPCPHCSVNLMSRT